MRYRHPQECVERRRLIRKFETFAKAFFADLDGDEPVQARVAGLPHLAHSSFTERREDFVSPNSVACGERHDEFDLVYQPETRQGMDYGPLVQSSVNPIIGV
jgi:hypothetical protein